MKQKIRITVTQETRVSLRVAGAIGAAWCPHCAAVVTMLTPDQAAALADVGTRQIFRWLESDRLHFVETDCLSPLVCLASLPVTTACEVNDDEAREAIARAGSVIQQGR